MNDEEMMSRLYHDHKISISEIARKFETSRYKVRQALCLPVDRSVKRTKDTIMEYLKVGDMTTLELSKAICMDVRALREKLKGMKMVESYLPENRKPNQGLLWRAVHYGK